MPPNMAFCLLHDVTVDHDIGGLDHRTGFVGTKTSFEAYKTTIRLCPAEEHVSLNHYFVSGHTEDFLSVILIFCRD